MHLHLSILSHLSHFDHLCMYKTSQQRLQPDCLAMKAISQMFCSLEEEMGHHSINNQCFHGISASLSLQNLNFVSFTLFYTFQIQYKSNYECNYEPHNTIQVMCLILWISRVVSTAHICWIISGTVQGWKQWYLWLQGSYFWLGY